MNRCEHYRADIDGLRAVAILSVVFFHAFPKWLTGGFSGVDIFFVISGYLISSLLLERLEKNKFSFTDFYIKRINRLFPALIAVLIFSLVFGWFVLFPYEYKQLAGEVVSGVGFVANFFHWHTSGYFDTAAESKPLLHLWSLGIEEQFYIIWPVILWAAWRKNLKLLRVIVGILLLSFALNMQATNTDKATAFFLPHTRFWELLVGGLLSYLIFYKHSTLQKGVEHLDKMLLKIVRRTAYPADGVTLKNFFSVLGLLLIACGLVEINGESSFPGAWALLPTLGALLLIFSGIDSWVNRYLLSSRFMIKVGLISYPLYLWHWPLLCFAHIMEEKVPSFIIRVVAIALSFLLAWLTYTFIEKPLRRSASKNINAFFLAACLFILGCLGVFIWISNGFDYRINQYNMAAKELIAYPRSPVEKFYECSDSIPLFKKFNFDGGCQLTKKTAPEIMFIGDSHTLHFKNAVWELFPTQSVLMVVQTSCLPFSSDYFLKGECREKYEAILAFLKTNTSVKKVYLSGYWSYLMSGGFSKTGHHWRIAQALSKDRTQSFITNGKRFIATITQTHKKVIFLNDIPDLDFNIHSCFVTRPWRLHGNAINQTCDLNYQQYQTRMLDYQKVIEQVLANFPGAQVYSPQHLFCKKNRCHARDATLPYYSNGDHLNHYGATMVIRDLQQQTRA